MDERIIQGIKKARRVVAELTRLVLELGTLIAVIKMVIQSVT